MSGVNTAGLVKLNINNNQSLGSSSFKTTAATRLATTTRATVPGFGVMAQRSLGGTGSIFNAKSYNSLSNSITRHGLNDGRTSVFNNYNPYPTAVKADNSDNKFANMLIAGGVLAAGIGSIVNALSSSEGAGDSTISTLNNIHKANSSSSSSSSGSSKDVGSIKEMKEAKDSTSLRGAIEAAEADEASMQSELSELEGKLPSMKAASEAATKQLETLKPKVEAQEKTVKEKETNVSNKETALSAAEKDKTAKLSVAQNMEAAVGEAATNYTKASEALVNAEATLASTPEKIMGPNGTEIANPAYANAQKAVEAAKQQKTEAKTKLDQAKANHEKAVENYEKSIDAYEKASGEVQSAKEELQTAKTDLEKAQTELNELKKQESDANGKVKDYENALDKQKDLTKDIKKYQDEIKDQKIRLTELEKDEDKELTETNNKMDTLSTKISKNNNRIDTSNGLNLMEKFLMKKNEKKSEKYDDLTNTRDTLQQKVNYTKLYKDASKAQTIGGKTFRTGSYNGETLYMIGAKPVTQEEFEKAKKAAEQAKKAPEQSVSA